MAASKPAWMKGLTAAQVKFYQELQGKAPLCRGRRRHDFALDHMMPGDGVPDTIKVSRARGVTQVEDHCRRACGRYIIYQTRRDGSIDRDTRRYFTLDASYLATGLGLTAADDAAYLDWLQGQVIADALRLAERRTEPERAAAQQRIDRLREVAGMAKAAQDAANAVIEQVTA